MTEQVGWCRGTRFETPVGGDSSSHNTTTIGFDNRPSSSLLSRLFALFATPNIPSRLGLARTLLDTKLPDRRSPDRSLDKTTPDVIWSPSTMYDCTIPRVTTSGSRQGARNHHSKSSFHPTHRQVKKRVAQIHSAGPSPACADPSPAYAAIDCCIRSTRPYFPHLRLLFQTSIFSPWSLLRHATLHPCI